MLAVIIPSIATIISTAIAGWFALQQTKQKKMRELELQGEQLRHLVEKRGDELLKCLALNTLHPNAHLCDLQDAVIKWDEAQSDYDNFLERLRIENLR